MLVQTRDVINAIYNAEGVAVMIPVLDVMSAGISISLVLARRNVTTVGLKMKIEHACLKGQLIPELLTKRKFTKRSPGAVHH